VPITMSPAPRTPRRIDRPGPGRAAVLVAALGRLLLIACTVIGVAALHTVGHAGVDTDQHSAATPGAVQTALNAVVPPSVRPADTSNDNGCDGDGCTHQIAMPGDGNDSRHGWDVCLAILTLLLVTVLTAFARRRTDDAPPRPATGRRRPPPRDWACPAVGLTLASTAVVRT
jgi:hypothetical protein